MLHIVCVPCSSGCSSGTGSDACAVCLVPGPQNGPLEAALQQVFTHTLRTVDGYYHVSAGMVWALMMVGCRQLAAGPTWPSSDAST